MNEEIILNENEFFGKGGLRNVFKHPMDNSKIIKLSSCENNDQNELEFSYYEHLKTKTISYNHISQCFGKIKTNLGEGLVFEKISNYDGSKCLELAQILEKGLLERNFIEKLLKELEEYIFLNNILFIDVSLSNVLCQEYEYKKYKLIIIDGLGGRYKKGIKSFLRKKIKFLSQKKIRKQWNKFLRQFNNEADIRYGNIFAWDKYSDQPQIIRNKDFKRRIRKHHINDSIKLLFTSMLVLPIAIFSMKLFRGKNEAVNEEFYGIGVNLDKDDKKGIQEDLVEELGVKNLIIRVPLKDIKNIDDYVRFASGFNKKTKKNILINILQDRENIENYELLRKNLNLIFDKFKNISVEFQIGSTINRLKWEFFSVKEYLNFYKIAQNLKDEKYPEIKLIGPSVIDFEYYYNVRAMFNFQDIKYDIVSSLLYVDRRGAPQNSQYGLFDTKNKIDLLYSLVKLSPKCSNEIYITEVNWPISNTAPYAPTSEHECVSNEQYTKYMLDYFKIARDSKKIKKVFWHQLIAPGYGLVDNRDSKIVKLPQYYAFKELLNEK